MNLLPTSLSLNRYSYVNGLKDIDTTSDIPCILHRFSIYKQVHTRNIRTIHLTYLYRIP